jgi:hypothetical protein
MVHATYRTPVRTHATITSKDCMSAQSGPVRNSWQHGLASMDFHVNVDLEGDGIVAEQVFGDVLRDAIRDLGIGMEDEIGMAIRARDQTGREHVIGIRFTARSVLTVDEIMAQITQAINSNQELNSQLLVTVTKRPQNRFARVQGHRRIARGDLHFFIKNKKCIVQINPPSDPVNDQKNCFAQWIGLGLSYLIQGHLLRPIRELELDEVSYRNMVQSRRKFTKRHQFVQRLQHLFDLSSPSDAILRQVERRYGVHLVLFSIFHEVQLQYPPSADLPVLDTRPVICGILQGSSIGSWEHVDFVTKPTGLIEGNHRSMRFCLSCFAIYARKQGCDRGHCQEDREVSCGFCHSCRNVCEGCKSIECGYVEGYTEEEDECEPFPTNVKCPACRVCLFSPKCKLLHDGICKEAFCRRCGSCGLKEHRGLECGETRCFLCGDAFPQEEQAQHRCYVKRKKLLPPDERFLVYDFECALDNTKIHIPYLCTVWFPLLHPQLDVLCDRYPYERVKDDVVFVFWGLGDKELRTGVYQFFDFVIDPLLEGYIFFAHNSRSYDGILVKYYMSKYLHEYSEDVQRGQKLLSMKFKGLQIEFRDSLCFIPTALRSMSKDFGIEELKKGHFPHKVMTVEYLEEAEPFDYIVGTPDRSAFDTDFRYGYQGEMDQQELTEWLDTFYASNPGTWNIKREAVDYCISDTVLLGRTLVQFREKLMTIMGSIARPADVDVAEFDPLRYLTLPSAMMSFYLSQLLPEKTIAVLDRAECFNRIEAEKYFRWMEHYHQLQLTRLTDEVCFSETDNTAFVYRDCYRHGCYQCYGDHQRNVRMNMSFAQCKFRSNEELDRLRSTYAMVEVIWQHEFDVFQREDDLYIDWFQASHIADVLPLDSREAYRGGKVELYYHCFPGTIQYADYNSEYPAICIGQTDNPFDLHGNGQLTWRMPTGQPTRLYFPDAFDIEDPELTGIIKCKVMAPTTLFAPFLGHRVSSRLCRNSYEVVYGLCRTCMENRASPCTHTTAEDRSFTGTWTIAEIHYALTLGYQVLLIVEVWIYESYSTDIFRSFIAPLIIEKMKNKRKGLVVNDVFTAKGEDVCQYVEKLSGIVLTPADFVDCPAAYTAAKTAVNAFTGKWGEKEEHQTTRCFNETQQKDSRALLTDPAVDIIFAQVLDMAGDLAVIQYQNKRNCTRGARHKNDHIISYVTGQARILLHMLEHVLGENLVYVDTDSAAHKMLEEPVYKHGYRTGDLELEIPEARNFVALGRKWYSMMLPNGNAVCKLKGFTLKQSTGDRFVSQKLYEHFVDCKASFDALEEPDVSAHTFNQQAPGIAIDQILFRTDKENIVTPYKRTVTMKKRAQFQMCSSKRYIMYPEATLDSTRLVTIKTYPYGFQGAHSI